MNWNKFIYKVEFDIRRFICLLIQHKLEQIYLPNSINDLYQCKICGETFLNKKEREWGL